MVQSAIEASLNEYEDNIIETNPSVAPIRPKPIFEYDERVVKVVLSEATYAYKIKTFEAIYWPPIFDNVEEVQISLGQRKLLYAIEKPIKPTNLFAKLDCRLMRWDQ